MKWEQLVKLGLELPEVTLEQWYGTPSLKVRKKGFVRLRPEGHSVVFLLHSLEEQEFLCESRPELYYITDHYKGWPSVLARLSELGVAEAKERLEVAWRSKAPPALIRTREQGGLAAAAKRDARASSTNKDRKKR
jgi:hypothetical protein